MKKLILSFLILFPILVKGQYTVIECGPNIAPAVNYIYLGSLTMASDNGANSQKMQVDIIGGGWGYTDKGTTTFYIANRGGISVNQVTTGGFAFGGSFLVAYQNGSNTDFYLSINSSASYYSLAVRSYIFGYAYTAQQVTITTTTSAPTGTNITSSLNINPLVTTDGNGNIGIGTTDTKGYKFGVNGSLIANSITVKVFPWADYVFKKDYHLPTLQEVKSYIDQNHHLPEIPTEQQVAKDGLNLGEMNKLLTKKVEELTLYLIEKNEKEKEQNQVNIQMQDKLKLQQDKLKTQQTQIDELNKKVSILITKINQN